MTLELKGQRQLMETRRFFQEYADICSSIYSGWIVSLQIWNSLDVRFQGQNPSFVCQEFALLGLSVISTEDILTLRRSSRYSNGLSATMSRKLEPLLEYAFIFAYGLKGLLLS